MASKHYHAFHYIANDELCAYVVTAYQKMIHRLNHNTTYRNKCLNDPMWRMFYHVATTSENATELREYLLLTVQRYELIVKGKITIQRPNMDYIRRATPRYKPRELMTPEELATTRAYDVKKKYRAELKKLRKIRQGKLMDG